jgi:transposase-like protein
MAIAINWLCCRPDRSHFLAEDAKETTDCHLSKLAIGTDLKEMMAERGIGIDHSTIHRWVVRFSPLLLERFNRRKRAVTRKWHVDETYIKVRGE